MGAASTKAAVTVGVNAPLTSGKETGIISASCNVSGGKILRSPKRQIKISSLEDVGIWLVSLIA